MAAVAGILFTDLVGLPKWWEAGAQQYAIDNQTLALIEIAVFAVLESKRYEGYKKTGEVGSSTVQICLIGILSSMRVCRPHARACKRTHV